ncbi:hypothetical protein J7T55_015208 [Diaporthe amygdali]|uniref:uncharacterized protein n=1 Tax=Phomopsis amygdali TaxID=1214568 RepID=UPI0022FE92E6|nr:uncharacterized protein J7T55_015208 [Diaporthe amygdali]KAJ0120479.1 hypothetical protein J7T55_015208 [Diaporthe amygdali]
MAKQVQNLAAWGYVVEPNARGFRNVPFSGPGRHCNIYHPKAESPDVPITTFTVNDDNSLLKIPRAFNTQNDLRPKGQKLNLRDQIVSFWTDVEGRDLKTLKRIEYSNVVEDNLRRQMEVVYDMMEKDEFDELTVKRTDPAFQLLLTTTPFVNGVQKMLDEYADKFAGKKIDSLHFDAVGGFESFDFIITLT